MDMKFIDLQYGDIFECYGDIHLNYNYPKICKCRKVGDERATEINDDGSDGMAFLIDDMEVVFKI